MIESVHPRRSHLARVRTGQRVRQQVLVANLDRVYIVASVSEPALRLGFVDRALVMASMGRVPEAVICVNKVDLDSTNDRRRAVDLYRGLGYPVLETSAETGQGMACLTAGLQKGLAVLVGPSGTGKSSLLNRVEPGLGLRTQELMRRHDRGRHTTTSISLHALQGGGYVADTPGVKQLQPWGLDTEALVQHFPELAPLHGYCQFRDCSHLHEPGCQIRAALAEGRLATSRYASYASLHADAEQLATPVY